MGSGAKMNNCSVIGFDNPLDVQGENTEVTDTYFISLPALHALEENAQDMKKPS